MAKIEIYTGMMCGYCSAAKRLLKKKGVEFDETDVSFSSGKRNEMMARANGQHSVPQIFIDDAHIGGCDDLYALESAGKLDAMIGIS
ncbi:MAG: glutaredoxin 3 [Rhodospirillaceae bacterium]|jgi:glutaredoxin 3|nr:glutaredoxin 3 [Rhodospirillaceae bacterium]MBT5357146.1 glutaredoxin 3 [Rhodospirillaceae bacterium]MBT5769153.1 glutaredoxin 3 [Rhodospirillaceae bacterium]MBT6308750.1 glutaredoxin 3 [Rhodospirillaceae bacterium]MBT7366456.1 glutaredoxin 3 [Rhodospirillaceae bacterium]